jgi:hypothetical protein
VGAWLLVLAEELVHLWRMVFSWMRERGNWGGTCRKEEDEDDEGVLSLKEKNGRTVTRIVVIDSIVLHFSRKTLVPARGYQVA